ncbi:MAG TPA: sensor domain-containing diguanylate cyclase [Blastocatellia bacterium]|nr:sensor domain-containing diguanylate cyclase [Blastocatellia bacterium]
MQEDDITTSIFEAAIRLHGSLDAGEVVSVAMEALPRLVQADSWAVFMKSEHADRLEVVRAINAEALTTGPFVDLSELEVPLVRAINARAPVVTESGDSSSLTLSVPLFAGWRLIGAVEAGRKRDNGNGPSPAFSAKDTRAIELVCGALAQALANAIDYHNAERQTLIDDLTRLYNVRYLYRTLEIEIRRARRYATSVSVVFMDLDGFKAVNDAYGHRAGSVTLTEVAEVITSSVRDSDFVARFGGDEFVLMLPETGAKAALQMAERVRAHINSYRFSGGIGATIHLTASFGVASFPEHAAEVEKLIELADSAMYEAKEQNKNNVRLAATSHP